jgi:hypothetical protein
MSSKHSAEPAQLTMPLYVTVRWSMSIALQGVAIPDNEVHADVGSKSRERPTMMRRLCGFRSPGPSQTIRSA